MKKIGFLLTILACFGSCKDPEARKPVSVKSGSFFEASVARNQELLKQEESRIKQLVQRDSLPVKISAHGFWYYYNHMDSSRVQMPEEDDLVTLNYNLRTLDEDTIYSKREIGLVTYKVDKQELFPGLRSAIKLMRQGETITFYFPSGLAYGYHGDDHKIGTNVPLISTVTLINIEKQTDSIH